MHGRSENIKIHKHDRHIFIHAVFTIGFVLNGSASPPLDCSNLNSTAQSTITSSNSPLKGEKGTVINRRRPIAMKDKVYDVLHAQR